DALHAERALLHHADFADRDVGIEMQMQRLVPRWIEEVEEAHVVGTRVGAVARADAAVVDLGVQTIGRVMTRIGRAYRLARRVVAVLAHHRTELQPDVGELALPVALDANPVLGAPAGGLIGSDRGDVVLRMAGGDARPAAVAAIEIDGEAPLRHVRGPRRSKGTSRRSKGKGQKSKVRSKV